MTLVITGSTGFLGWHTRVLARTAAVGDVVGVRDLADPDRLAGLLDGADRVVHLAGVNRGEHLQRNVALARALADGLRRCATPPKVVVYANSIQAGNGTPYGDAKAAAAQVLAEATEWSGSTFVDLRLPNLFGEHGRPHYNSVVATFCRVLADGGEPRVDADRELELMHATDAAAMLLGLRSATPTRRTVAELAARLGRFASLYRTGELPDLRDPFDVRLFNTYRSHAFDGTGRPVPVRGDARGGLFEGVRANSGGQAFVSTTRPGVTRGEHFHLAKVERFLVLRGEAEIRLRRLFHADVVRIRVSGAAPTFVDMPAMWAHSITNVGDDDLLTLFWSNDLFDPADPDTYPEAVLP